MFTARDHRQLEERGIDPAAAARQIELLRDPPRITLERAATRGDGIRRIAAAEYEPLERAAASAASAGRLMALVPASGAATRMFKDLRAALESAAAPRDTEAGRRFFESIESFPFAEELRARAGSLERSTPEDEKRILEVLLDGMSYAETPKGLIPFHRTSAGPRTPLEEHLLQARRYLRAADGTVRAHFTVAAGHVADFERALAAVRPSIEQDGSRLAVTFSEQHRSTDTVALDSAGAPFRLADGSLLLRPSGHGALLENLEAAGGEIVSIRNIDNVVRDEASEEVVRWKRILIGALVGVQREIFAILDEVERGAGEAALDRAIALARESFRRLPEGPPGSADEKRAFVRAALDRPLRVCGVVLNEGEPGGAPLWVEGAGGPTLQIVESSQVDVRDPDQKRIWESATHFNPVDVIAALRGRDGTRYRLADFVDPRAVFVAKKSHEGRELLALELPGLWNGAMAGWNTVFVEVPAATFAPVKTVFDLLRPAHQG